MIICDPTTDFCLKPFFSTCCLVAQSLILISSLFPFLHVSTTLSGLKPAFEAFLCFALTMSLVSLAGVGLAFLVSASVSSFAMANILIALPFVFMMVRDKDTNTNTHKHYKCQPASMSVSNSLPCHPCFRFSVVSLSISMPC